MDDIQEKIRAIIAKGNVTKIVIRKNGNIVASFPVTLGVAGVVIAPWAMILGVIGTLGAQAEILFIDQDGQVLGMNGKVVGMYDRAKDTVEKVTEGKRMSDIKDFGKKALEKGQEAFEIGQKAFEKGYDKAVDAYEKANADGKIDKAVSDVKDFAGKAADEAIKLAKEAAKKIEK